MVNLSVGKRLSQLLSILFNFPNSEAIRNTTAGEFCNIFPRNVFLIWSLTGAVVSL